MAVSTRNICTVHASLSRHLVIGTATATNGRHGHAGELPGTTGLGRLPLAGKYGDGDGAMSDDFGPPSPARSPRSECDDWWLLRCRCRGLARTCVVRRILWYHTDGARALVCGAHRGLDSTRWGADSTYFAGAGYGTVDAREEGATAPLIARALPLS